MAILATVGALVWNNVTVKSPDAFAALTEIRTNVIELKSSVTDLNVKLDRNQQQTSAQQAKISALETGLASNKEAIDKLAENLNDRSRPH